MIQIVLKSGYVIEVKGDASVDSMKEMILKRNDFISIGDNFIRTDDISAILTIAHSVDYPQ